MFSPQIWKTVHEENPMVPTVGALGPSPAQPLWPWQCVDGQQRQVESRPPSTVHRLLPHNVSCVGHWGCTTEHMWEKPSLPSLAKPRPRLWQPGRSGATAGQGPPGARPLGALASLHSGLHPDPLQTGHWAPQRRAFPWL